jgi:acyl-CoA synthetase (AMP-forming)/AMP-acid ligase II
MPGHALRIVDPETGHDLPERWVGEVVLRGPSLSPYYFRKGFDHGPARDELRTGDLGYLADGDLYLVDRLKDLLILGGRNYVPSDVERVAGAVTGVRSGAVVAFGTRGTNGTDELVVVVGTEPRSGVPSEDLKKEVRRAVHAAFNLVPREVVLVRPNAIPKTSSGKLQRSACKNAYEAGAFQGAGSVPEGP